MNPKIWKVIEVIENHFDDLCGLGISKKLKGADRDVPFSITTNLITPGNSKKGLLRLAMVGSAERTLQGEVFYAIRTNEVALGGSAILEMKVSKWHHHRNIDCVITPHSPNKLDDSIFIELGHHTTVQHSNPVNIISNKIKKDVCAPLCPWTNNFGPILHVMFVTHMEDIKRKKPGNVGIWDWPRLPGYFVQKWATTSQLQSSTFKDGRKKQLDDIHNHLSSTMKSNYIGHVKGCDETIDFGNGVFTATGRVDRFYSVHP